MSPTTGVRDNMESAEHPSTAGLVIWTIAAFLVTLSLPFIVAIVTHVVIGPSFLTGALDIAVVVIAWLVTVVVALAWVVAGERLRRAGAALIVGESLGLLVFAALVWWVLTHPTGSS